VAQTYTRLTSSAHITDNFIDDMRYFHRHRGSAPNVDQPLIKTSTNLDEAIQLLPNSFVSIIRTPVKYENKGVNPTFAS
jgi:hypothetical protein